MIVVGGDENNYRIALVSSKKREAYPVSPNFLPPTTHSLFFP
jgi:hypothetical protein